jgi:hypothetical protein
MSSHGPKGSSARRERMIALSGACRHERVDTGSAQHTRCGTSIFASACRYCTSSSYSARYAASTKLRAWGGQQNRFSARTAHTINTLTLPDATAVRPENVAGADDLSLVVVYAGLLHICRSAEPEVQRAESTLCVPAFPISGASDINN